jgi:TRAP-type mannitol/chloroaromatic compound transport system permease small subunit
MKFAQTLDKILDILSKGALLISGILLLAMAFNVTYGVLARYVFERPSVIAIELTKILMIPALVLAVSYVQRNERHLKVDFISSHFSPTIQLIMSQIAVPILGLFVGYVLVWKGWVSMAYSFRIHETSYASWQEPLWPVRLTIPIGYGLLCLIMIGQIVKGIGVLIRGKQKAPPENLEETTTKS